MPEPQNLLARMADPNQASVFDSTMEQVMRRLAQAIQNGELKNIALAANTTTNPISGRSVLPMDEASRMSRAKNLGFTEEVFHGTADDVPAFDLSHPNRKDAGWLGDGVYVTSSPELASSYPMLKAGTRENVMPLRARIANPYEATLADKEQMMLYENRFGREAARQKAQEITRDLQARGYDSVRLQYHPEDVGPKNVSTETVVFDPANLRSKFAAFDPSRVGANDLLASIVALFGASALARPEWGRR